MAVYKLFPKSGSPSVAADLQRKTVLSQLQNTQFKQDSAKLEATLNEFFYSKTGDNYEKYYERASALATEAFNERYSSYPFELNMEKMTAKFTNPNISFINRSTATLAQVQRVAQEIEMFMAQNNIKREKWSGVIAKIQSLQSLSEWSDVRDLNGIVASIMFGNKTAYGDAFEYPLAAFASLLENEADATADELLDTFEKNLQGGVRSKSYLNVAHVSKKDRKFLNIKNSIPINNGAILEYSNPTQDKIDVVLKLDGSTFNISAKSYSSIYKDIHILGGASLAAPVLNLSSENFVSHYLTELYRDGDLNDLHEAVRLNILFMSLTGAGSSDNQADTFVLNDKANGRIYVRNMSDIVSYVASGSKWAYLDINGGGCEVPDSALRNYQRIKVKNTIGSMLTAMHAIKLQVSIKGTAIKNAIVET